MTRVVGGLALIAGGLSWVAAAVVLAGKPYGDTAVLRLLGPAEPLSSTYRFSGPELVAVRSFLGDDAAPIIGVAVAATLLGLALIYAQASWAAGGWGKAAVALLALGGLLVAPWPLLLIGFLGLVSGMVVLGITALRTGLLPRSAAVMLIAAAGLFFLFNSEDDRALFFVAPGAAFAWLGLRAVMKRRPMPA